MEARIVHSLSSDETKLDAVDRANLAIATGCYAYNPMTGLSVRAIKQPRQWVKRQQAQHAIWHTTISETETGAHVVVKVNDYLALVWDVANYDWAISWFKRNTSARINAYPMY